MVKSTAAIAAQSLIFATTVSTVAFLATARLLETLAPFPRATRPLSAI